MQLRRTKIHKAELLRCLPELAETTDKDLTRLSRLFDEMDYPAGAVMIARAISVSRRSSSSREASA